MREKRGPYITILAAEQTIAEPGLWGCRPAASLPSKCVHSHFSKTTILSKFGCYCTGRARREDINIILTSSAKLMPPLLIEDNSVNKFRKATYVILCHAPAGNALAETFGNYQLQADCQHRSCQTWSLNFGRNIKKKWTWHDISGSFNQAEAEADTSLLNPDFLESSETGTKQP